MGQAGNGEAGSQQVGGREQPKHNDRLQPPLGLGSGALKGVVQTVANGSTCTRPDGAALCEWLPRGEAKPSRMASSFHFSREVGIERFKNTEKLLNLNVSE